MVSPVRERLRRIPSSRTVSTGSSNDRTASPTKRPGATPRSTSRSPEVRQYLSDLVKTIHSWGVDYFKMDGLWTGSATEQIYVNDGYRDDQIGNNAPFHDPKKTNIEVMRDGLQLLRQAAGPEVFFSGCNLSQNMRSLAGSIGLVDSMRIGPDNGQGWRNYREEIAANGSGSIITGPVRGTRLYFMHGRFWWNDPDPCYVRAGIPLKHARLITSWVALSGQFNLNSDWIPGLPPERLELLKRTMPHHGVTARPVDYFDTVMPGIWLVTDARQSRASRRARPVQLGIQRPVDCLHRQPKPVWTRPKLTTPSISGVTRPCRRFAANSSSMCRQNRAALSRCGCKQNTR